MVFSSPLFLFIFLPITLLLYWFGISRSKSLGKNILIFASLAFYGWWDIFFVPIILFSIVVNYYLGTYLQEKKNRKVLVLGILANLILIAIYKYTDFAISTVNFIANSEYSFFNLALPLAISFFTFQQIAYLVDSYQSKVTDNTKENYFLFVLFFPQLIAGPIVHHSEMMPQYENLKRLKEIASDTFIHGIILIIVGLFKKIIIADSLANWVNPVFLDPSAITLLDAWTGILAYTFQIYFDFSAYSEMAMGLALLFGIKLPLNFCSPYKSKSIGGFWRTWHITLGRFLKQYLYIPLGGNRNGAVIAISSLTVTMLLGGLWHGAGWQFVLWGGLHGVFLSIAFVWGVKGFRLPNKLAIGITFFAVVFAWVPFRANSIVDAISYWKAMFGFNGIMPQPLHATILTDILGEPVKAAQSYFTGWEIFVLFLIAYAVMKFPNIHFYINQFKPNIKNYAYLTVMAISSIAIMGRPQTFIYFAF
jgi:alginate O-acetyltransferase complex protein AlgI